MYQDYFDPVAVVVVCSSVENEHLQLVGPSVVDNQELYVELKNMFN